MIPIPKKQLCGLQCLNPSRKGHSVNIVERDKIIAANDESRMRCQVHGHLNPLFFKRQSRAHRRLAIVALEEI